MRWVDTGTLGRSSADDKGERKMRDHPENTPKTPHGQHRELIEMFTGCANHMPMAEIVEMLAVIGAELEIRGVDVKKGMQGIVNAIPPESEPFDSESFDAK